MPNRGIASEYEHAQNEGNHDRRHRHDQTGQHIAVIQHIFADLGGSGRVKADGGDTLAGGRDHIVGIACHPACDDDVDGQIFRAIPMGTMIMVVEA